MVLSPKLKEFLIYGASAIALAGGLYVLYQWRQSQAADVPVDNGLTDPGTSDSFGDDFGNPPISIITDPDQPGTIGNGGAGPSTGLTPSPTTSPTTTDDPTTADPIVTVPTSPAPVTTPDVPAPDTTATAPPAVTVDPAPLPFPPPGSGVGTYPTGDTDPNAPFQGTGFEGVTPVSIDIGNGITIEVPSVEPYIPQMPSDSPFPVVPQVSPATDKSGTNPFTAEPDTHVFGSGGQGNFINGSDISDPGISSHTDTATAPVFRPTEIVVPTSGPYSVPSVPDEVASILAVSPGTPVGPLVPGPGQSLSLVPDASSPSGFMIVGLGADNLNTPVDNGPVPNYTATQNTGGPADVSVSDFNTNIVGNTTANQTTASPPDPATLVDPLAFRINTDTTGIGPNLVSGLISADTSTFTGGPAYVSTSSLNGTDDGVSYVTASPHVDTTPIVDTIAQIEPTPTAAPLSFIDTTPQTPTPDPTPAPVVSAPIIPAVAPVTVAPTPVPKGKLSKGGLSA